MDNNLVEKSKVGSHEGNKEHSKEKGSWIQKAGTVVAEGLEKFFYKLGYLVASKPWTVVMCIAVISSICSLGMLRFESKDSSQPIWIPSESIVLKNEEWVKENFPVNYRYNTYIITAANVLEPHVIKQINEIDVMVKNLEEVNNTKSILNFNWTSLCIRVSGECWSNSILELWSFNQIAIQSLSTLEEVVDRIDQTNKSPVFNFELIPTNWLGGVSYDERGRIVGAEAALMVYVLKATTTDESDISVVGPDLLWETKFVKLGLELNQNSSGSINNVSIHAVRSFRDESDASFLGDLALLIAGIALIVTYVAVVLGRFNEVEHKVYLAFCGVIGIGLSTLVSYSLASALGMFYGPIHPLLPFLLLGLGVDDMFVIVEAWNNLSKLERNKDLKIKMAITLKHAGVSITVTSVTDFVSFAIGASTKLPGLRSFCVYAALGILALFIIQSTFFVAWFTIDQRRQNASRDACCIWIKYVDFEPNHCSQRLFLPWFLRNFFTKFILSLPVKVVVTVILFTMLSISGYGTALLRTESDLTWFLSPDSYLRSFLDTQKKYFTSGVMADLYIGDIDYFKSNDKIVDMTSTLNQMEFVEKDSVKNWHGSYITWMRSTEGITSASQYGIPTDDNGYPTEKIGYYKLLSIFLASSGLQFYNSLRWNDSNPSNYRRVLASKIGFVVKELHNTDEKTKALDHFENFSATYFAEDSFIWAPPFRDWETNRKIQQELYVNIALAFVAVFIVTLLLVGNILACVLVCSCVIITLVNVCGMMHFWGMTIDTLTSILLIISIGLAVDYSAHIGHKFMTVYGSRNERAEFTVANIGPAVINGGFSTYLAFILLATSKSYVFTTFFRIFTLVISFGLFNGVCVLPVLLSWMGPPPHLHATSITKVSEISLRLRPSWPSKRKTTESSARSQKLSKIEGELASENADTTASDMVKSGGSANLY